MMLLHRLASVLRWVAHRNRAEQDLNDELQAFVDMAAADKMRDGASRQEARRLAVLHLGGVEQAKERVRSARHGAWLDEVGRDLRYGLRQVRRNPAFSGIAIATLALGIGVNTALFSLWHDVLYAPLPGVDRPEGLVMLTDPEASGMLRGHDDGERRWLSYAEFEQLRDHAGAFSALMASQSSLNGWQVRIGGGAPEVVNGRLVSGGFFEVFGVRPAIGRLFTTNEDSGQPPYAVISHGYWQRRFSSRPQVIGETLIIRDTPVTIVGVAPAGFVGETSGQRPDLWLPLPLQPRVLPGGDWLQENPPDKVMWLHVFGRLKPGVTNAQAEAQANTIFLGGLESFYGVPRRHEARGQRLRLQSGARGAWSLSRYEVSSSLTMLLGSAGVLLLIACANLANLLVARGLARQTEIAVRVSLGASRQRVIRQLVTESLALAGLGGIAAIAAAYVMHQALMAMLQEVDPRFFMAFTFSAPLLAFLMAAILAAALVFGALPAWQVTRSDPDSHLKDSTRGAVGPAGELRAGRWLVGLQLALCLPLLVGAGLLVQTVNNLQRPDLGFDAGRLLVARVELGALVQDVARRDLALRELLARILRIPGVEAASFSQLGLFTGGFSTATIEVSGNRSAAAPGSDAALDRVGANYFTTLRVPIVRGRDIAENDRADTHKVCIVNEAFARRYFGGQDPVGGYVTTVDDGVRVAYEVVGLVRDAHTRSIREDVEPRFFVPAEQRPSQGVSRTFLIRTRAGTNDVMSAVRDVTSGVDVELSRAGVDLASIEDHLSPLIADERTTARLAVVFGTVALALAAIGLYGVLSYGINRRSSEIAIRIALGARSRSIVVMVLRRTAGLVLGGLLAGGVLAYVGSRLIASRLYGIAPQDPLNLMLATGVLLLVAFVASYLPARRASRTDPLAALHQG
jgi:predicted permease